MKIGIVIGSIREGRKGEHVGRWVEGIARDDLDVDVEVIDLKEFDVPLLTAPTPPAAANRSYDSANVRRWSDAIDACDGYVFITPEYNHGVPGAFKNAVDTLAPEWSGKAVGFVSYGTADGIRAVEQWRQIVANFQMIDIRAQVAMSNFTEFAQDGSFTPLERRESELRALLDQLTTVVARGR
ncbi:NADPH-dependent oxidoreductase [Aeromicrobium camelliae]|uniref:NADPH-dependent oxidoreductase n=1 Tax=Aeromicrobium camelliae TaxID=1538144 RepID=A0A3N6W471_9ACTN|nr:NAD(P)H-dependent oxidoreductase [Aeromicrobium camelliae]RQN02329.1 NADPH-dependent oxidoreductase [Aeromicrobium camelliae]